VDGWQTYAVNPGEYAKDILIDGNILCGFFHQAMMLDGRTTADTASFSADTITISNNVFADAWNGIVSRGVRNLRIYHNTFIISTVGRPSCLGLMLGDGPGGAQTTASVKNNIFYHGMAFHATTRMAALISASLVEMEGNLLYSPARKYKEGFGNNVLNKDPLFVDPANPAGPDGKPFTADDGYGLLSDSPCINAGVRVEDTVGARDILGNSRPQGSGWDIGACEFGAGAPAR